MTGNEYQTLANRTLIDEPDFVLTKEQVMIVWQATGLAGEAGEVSELVKKGIFHQQGIDILKVKKELGDVLWYLAALCKVFDIPMEEIMKHNIEKLKARFPDGYTPERTMFREGDAF
jgi:NTP pyrophosphatase (non-canonical NTP hydrolase)